MLETSNSIKLVNFQYRPDAQAGISDDQFLAVNDIGLNIDPRLAVLPIVKKSANGKDLSVIGTGFFVGPSVIMTAKHVLENERWEDIACLQFFGGDRRDWRRIMHCTVLADTDLAICVLTPPESTYYIGSPPNYVFRIGGRDPAIGTKIVTYCYPDSTFHRNGEEAIMTINPHYYAGSLSKAFPQGRDAAMLPFPCYQTSMHIHGGASGGPVLDPATGIVFAINTSSFFGATDISYVAKIHPILDTPIPKIERFGTITIPISLRNLTRKNLAMVIPENALIRTGNLAPDK